MWPRLRLEWCAMSPVGGVPTEFILAGPLQSAGRGENVHLRIDSQHVARAQCVFRKHEAGWELQDFGDNPVAINGDVAGRSALLRDGDWLEFPIGIVYRFLERERAEPPVNRAMERAIIAAPDDASRPLVWSDWLEEQGAGDLAARVRQGSPANLKEELQWAGPFARNVASGGLRLNWKAGFPHRARLFDPLEWGAAIEAPAWIGVMMAHPLFRFLSELAVDPLSFFGPSIAGASVLELTRRNPQLLVDRCVAASGGLRSLEVGPLPRRSVSLERPGVRLVWFGPASLELVSAPPGCSPSLSPGAQHRLTEQHPTVLGTSDAAAIRWHSSHPSEAVLVNRDHAWWSRQDGSARRLYSGDLLEVGGVTFRFLME